MAGTQAITYHDQALREDLLSIISNLTPTENQLMTGLGTSTAKSIRHEWLMDTLSAVKDNAQLEGAAATYHTTTDPTRIYNYCQIFKQGYQVSDTERAVDTAGFNDRYTYEQTKALRMLKNDMEYALMRGSLASGQTNVARRLRGVKASLSIITSSSGVSLTEAILNDYFQAVWTSSAAMVNAVYCPMYLKRKISAFTAGATKNFNQTDRRLIAPIDIYEADAASVVKLFAHRHITISGTDTNYDIVGINEDYFKVAYLRKPFIQDIATTGDFSGGNVVAEATLESLHYHAGFLGLAHL
jgi:hypothetical protein